MATKTNYTEGRSGHQKHGLVISFAVQTCCIYDVSSEKRIYFSLIPIYKRLVTLAKICYLVVPETYYSMSYQNRAKTYTRHRTFW